MLSHECELTCFGDTVVEHIDNVYDRVHADTDLYGSDFGHLVIGIVVLELELHPKLQLFEVDDFTHHITIKLLLLLIFVHLARGFGCVVEQVREEHHFDHEGVKDELHGKNETRLSASKDAVGAVRENLASKRFDVKDFSKINDINSERSPV